MHIMLYRKLFKMFQLNTLPVMRLRIYPQYNILNMLDNPVHTSKLLNMFEFNFLSSL